MAEGVFFAEDSAQELFVTPLIVRIAGEYAVGLSMRTITARGGVPRMMGLLRAYCTEVEAGVEKRPDIIIIVRDANCKGAVAKRRETLEFIPESLRDVACVVIPDPHVERWFMLDSRAFNQATHAVCSLPGYKCEKNHYKKLLRDALAANKIVAPLGGVEYAKPIGENIDIRVNHIHDDAYRGALKTLRDRFSTLRVVSP